MVDSANVATTLKRKGVFFGFIFYFLISCGLCDAIGPVRRSSSVRKGNTCGECKRFLLCNAACLKIRIILSLCRVLQSCCSSRCIKFVVPLSNSSVFRQNEYFLFIYLWLASVVLADRRILDSLFRHSANTFSFEYSRAFQVDLDVCFFIIPISGDAED